ncbi:ABC-type Fe3+-siderophore transport system permease subunit [Sagittula marina]|uniref:ABC-type Fe3+-siderophore transport system permease subunit n=1 Tax=Sagittula marina TaxID=943940 RepID=A0A7W6DS06_9RHOB|nr:iron chelate uptake ABC transporter family permease subunit [Sagittula marina]MBB3985827.1 ABC-type Fe3+-siderophore transport system permease subunit [Sagittula marina]
MQALLRNQLADPYLVGLFAGVSTGALLVLGYVVVLAHAVSGSAGGDRATRAAAAIIPAGIVASQMFNALTAFTIACSANAEQARGIMFLLKGKLSAFGVSTRGHALWSPLRGRGGGAMFLRCRTCLIRPRWPYSPIASGKRYRAVKTGAST